MKKVLHYPVCQSFYITMLLLLLAISSCADIIDSDENKDITLIDENIPASSMIKPLCRGNYWIYNLYYYDSANDTLMLNNEEQPFDYILKDTVIGNRRWFTGDSSGSTWYLNRGDGLHKLIISKSTKTDYLIVKYPGYLNSEFTDDSNKVWKIVSIDTLIKTSAGSFNCLCYLDYRTWENSFTKVYYSPGVGMVLRETFIWWSKKNKLIISKKEELVQMFVQ